MFQLLCFFSSGGIFPNIFEVQFKGSAVEISLFNAILLKQQKSFCRQAETCQCWQMISLLTLYTGQWQWRVFRSVLSFSVSRVLSANYVRMRDLSLIADWLFSSNLPPRAPHTRSAHLSALFTVSRTLTNSNLIFCLLVAIASGGRGCREIKVNPKLVYQNCDAPGLSDVARRNIYRQSLLFIVQMFDANVFAKFFPFPNCVWGECD